MLNKAGFTVSTWCGESALSSTGTSASPLTRRRPRNAAVSKGEGSSLAQMEPDASPFEAPPGRVRMRAYGAIEHCDENTSRS